jgi:hypothetical protein
MPWSIAKADARRNAGGQVRYTVSVGCADL